MTHRFTRGIPLLNRRTATARAPGRPGPEPPASSTPRCNPTAAATGGATAYPCLEFRMCLHVVDLRGSVTLDPVLFYTKPDLSTPEVQHLVSPEFYGLR